MMKQLFKFSSFLFVFSLFLFTACQEDALPEVSGSEDAIIDLREDGTFDVMDTETAERLDWVKRFRGRKLFFGRLNQCFDLVFPVTLNFPDGTTEEVASAEDLRSTLRDWKANQTSGIGGRPQLAFPFEVELADGDTYTIEEKPDLREIAGDCTEGRPHFKGRFKRCFELVFPVGVSYPDGTTAEAADREELKTLFSTWRTENPDATEHPTLAYPLDIELTDGTTVTVDSREAIREAISDCRRPRPHFWRNRCFDLVFPVSVELNDETVVEVADQEALYDVYKEWLESDPRGDHPEVIFPVDVTLESDGSVVTLNSLSDLEDLQDVCRN